jgi:hypothetical protein
MTTAPTWHYMLLLQHETEAAGNGMLHSIGGMWTSCLACTQVLAAVMECCLGHLPSARTVALQFLQLFHEQGKFFPTQ